MNNSDDLDRMKARLERFEAALRLIVETAEDRERISQHNRRKGLTWQDEKGMVEGLNQAAEIAWRALTGEGPQERNPSDDRDAMR